MVQTPTQLTTTNPNINNNGDDGDLDAWQFPAATYVQIAVGCGALGIAKLVPGQTTPTPITIPQMDNTSSIYIIGSDGNRLAIIGSYPCAGGPVLAWYDTSNNTTTPLLGGPVNGGSALSAVLYGEDPAVP